MGVEKRHVARGGKNIIFRRGGGGNKYCFQTEIQTPANLCTLSSNLCIAELSSGGRPYSHTTVPSKLSTRLLLATRAYIPEDKVILPVSSFILANSSRNVISYSPCAAVHSESSHCQTDDSCFTVAVVVHGPTQEHRVGHCGPQGCRAGTGIVFIWRLWNRNRNRIRTTVPVPITRK